MFDKAVGDIILTIAVFTDLPSCGWIANKIVREPSPTVADNFIAGFIVVMTVGPVAILLYLLVFR